MPIGLALILIFILYLIDKNQRWRQTFKFVLGLAVLGAVITGGWFGWAKWDDYRTAKREAAIDYQALACKAGAIDIACKAPDPFASIAKPIDPLAVLGGIPAKPAFNPNEPYSYLPAGERPVPSDEPIVWYRLSSGHVASLPQSSVPALLKQDPGAKLIPAAVEKACADPYASIATPPESPEEQRNNLAKCIGRKIAVREGRN